MKKIIKISSITFMSLLVMVSSFLILKAWDAPTVKKYELEEVEFRSVWVCTVANMDVQKQIGTSPEAIQAWKDQYLDILYNSKAMGMNAIIFQVRPCNDAFYPSKYNPWSEYLAGFGVDPGWDPLEWMLEVTHAAGLEYHAWLNPYRTSTGALSYYPTTKDQATGSTYWGDYSTSEAYNYKQEYFKGLADTLRNNNNVVDNPIMETGSTLNHQIVYGSESKFVLNPADPVTIELLDNTIKELVENYDIDGIHFDDYFYPDDSSYKGTNTDYKNITFSTQPDIDYADYKSYLNDGGTLSIYDFRRDNVNRLIKTLSDTIRELNKTDDYICAFGISPAARWAPSIESCPAGSPRAAEGGEAGSCNNYYSYSDLYADTRKWVLEDWIDYILPQAYTYLGTSTSGIPSGTYSGIVKWWSDVVKDTKCKLYVGTPAYQVATWTTGKLATKMELYYQIRYCQSQGYNTEGFVMFRYESLIAGVGQNAMNMVTNALWKIAALTPVYESYTYPSLNVNAEVNKLKKNGDGTYTVFFDVVDDAKAYGVTEDGIVINRVLGRDTEMTFAADESKEYKLITYGKDNHIVSTSATLDLSNAEVNQAPVITFNSTLDQKYAYRSEVGLSFSITDPENDPLTYKLVVKYDTNEYNLASGDVVGGSVNYTFKCYSYTQPGIYFVLTINDGHNEVEYTTSTFDLVPESEIVVPTDPIDPVEPDPVTPEKEETGKKKCGKKSSELIISMLSLSSLLFILIRRRNK